jgi:hypothetical protein
MKRLDEETSTAALVKVTHHDFGRGAHRHLLRRDRVTSPRRADHQQIGPSDARPNPPCGRNVYAAERCAGVSPQLTGSDGKSHPVLSSRALTCEPRRCLIGVSMMSLEPVGEAVVCLGRTRRFRWSGFKRHGLLVVTASNRRIEAPGLWF